MDMRLLEADAKLQEATRKYEVACRVFTRITKELETAQAAWTEASATEEEKKIRLIAEVTAWIDTQVIAELVVSGVIERGEPLTLEACQAVWLRQLMLLGEDL